MAYVLAALALLLGFSLGLLYGQRRTDTRRSEDLSLIERTVVSVATHVATAVAIPGGTSGTVKQAADLPREAEPFADLMNAEDEAASEAWDRQMDDEWLRPTGV